MIFQPKLLTTLKKYSREAFFSDILAGLIVGIVALPLAIAFGIASGVTPEKGLITAIVAGFIISALGGSRVQIGGPTGAFVVIVYGIVQRYGVDGLTVATFLAGLLLMAMGIAQLGNVIQFIPHPVVVGFTSGIAVIIFSSQVKDFLGLSMGKVPAEFFEKWTEYFRHIQTLNPFAFLIAAGTVIMIAYWPKVSRKIPGSLVALLLFSIMAVIFHWPVETIGSRFGDLPRSLPAPHMPALSWGLIKNLFRPALTIALLAGIESLLSAVVADSMIGGSHRSNTELIAQGMANIGSAVFGGIPATGAIARTATNIKNGGRTPVAGITHSLALLLILFFAGPLAKWIPLSCLAGILVIVAYHMSEWRSFLALLRGPKSDIAVLAATFFLTVFVDLTVAIEAGMVLAAFLFMHRMASVTRFQLTVPEDTVQSRPKTPEGVEVYEITGPLFFGVSHQFEEAMRIIEKMPRVRILKLEHVPAIDASGQHSLEQFHKKCQRAKIELVLVGVRPQPLKVMKKTGFYEHLGADHFTDSHEGALRLAEHWLSSKKAG